MKRRPLARYVPPVLLVATCSGGCGLSGCRTDGGMPYPDDPVADGYPDIWLDPEVLEFGAVDVGGEATKEAQVCNLGDVDLEILGVEVDEGEAFAAGALGAAILGAAMCTSFEVAFAPVTPGLAQDTVWVESDDPDTSFASVALSGEGVSPP